MSNIGVEEFHSARESEKNDFLVSTMKVSRETFIEHPRDQESRRYRTNKRLFSSPSGSQRPSRVNALE